MTLVIRVLTSVRQWWCGVRHGHSDLLHFESGRINLICDACGYETPGWDCRGGYVASRH